MIKIDLARIIAEKLGVTQAVADAFITAFIESIYENLPVEKIQLAGLGVFDKRYVPAHPARNPKTGETLPGNVPACYYPTFKAGKVLKERVASAPLPEDSDTATPTETITIDPKPVRKKKAGSAS